MSDLSRRPDGAVVGETIPHESAALHVTGHALYTDDLVAATPGVLHAQPVQAPHAHARVTGCASTPAYDVPGVVRVLTADDVPGVNDAGVKHDEPLFPTEVMYHGHAVCWVLGETLEAARLGAAAVEVDYEPLPALVDGPRGDRGRQLPGRPADRASAATSRRASRRRPTSSAASTEMAGQEHFYLETHCSLALVDEGGQVFVQCSTQHPTETQEIVAHVLGRRQPRGHRAVPADGRRVRRQGDAAARVRRDRGARRDPHRPPGPAAAHPHPGHDDDRQAARLPRPVAGRLRRRRPPAGARRHADLRRRLEPRPVRAGAGAGALPRRQRLLDPPRARQRPDRADQQDLADRLPRLRRPAGDAGHRGHPRPVRAAARHRPDRAAPPQLLRRRARPRRTASRCATPSGWPPPGTRCSPTRRRRARGGRRSRSSTPRTAHTKRGAGDHAGEVRDLVQLHRLQPGRRARARLQGRLGADQPRRHRDGPGPAHQDAPGRGHRARRAARAGPARADPHRQGAQHLRHRRELGRRPQRRRGQERLRADPRAGWPSVDAGRDLPWEELVREAYFSGSSCGRPASTAPRDCTGTPR